MKVLKLKQRGNFHLPTKEYEVVGIINTTEWSIGEGVSKEEINQILRRNGTHSVKVEIK